MQESLPNRLNLRGAGYRPGLVVVLYAAFGVFWIVVGEWLASRLTAPVPVGTPLQVAKGLAFVTVTSLLLYMLLRWRERRRSTFLAPVEVLLEQLPGLLWTTDRQLRLVSVAGSGRSDFPVQTEGMIGHRFPNLVTSPDHRGQIEGEHRKALSGKVAEYRIDVGGRTFLSRVEPLRQRSGSIVGCVGFSLDVTDLATPGAEGGLRWALRRTRSMASLGALVLDVAHQFKNPLFAMSSALDAFEQRVGDHPETERHRAILREQVERMEKLVTGLQEYGQIQTLHVEPCDLPDLLGQLEVQWSGRARELGLELQVERPRNQPVPCELDPRAISRALSALLDNALAHTPAPGTVRLSARWNEGPPHTLAIRVEDTGPGFTAADLRHLPRPLFSRRPGGTGLGLAVAERIAELHGGRLELEAPPSGGAAVTLHLPVPH